MQVLGSVLHLTPLSARTHPQAPAIFRNDDFPMWQRTPGAAPIIPRPCRRTRAGAYGPHGCYGPLSQRPNVRHGNTGDTGDYPPEEVAQMAHSLAVKAITTP
jgi:hypothetical protein